MNSNQSCPICPPTWKKILAFLTDFTGSFLIFGYIIAYFSNNLTSEGFHLEGAPALLLFAVMVSYFIIMKIFFGGTFGKKLFRISQRKLIGDEKSQTS